MSLWSCASFSQIYGAIIDGSKDLQLTLLQGLPKDTLLNMLEHPKKSDGARKELESSHVTFTDGLQYELNQSFIEDSIRVSNILNLDEKIAAEVLFYALNSNVNAGVNPVETAIIAWYDRNTFILQILSYYLNKNESTQNGSPKYFVIDLIKGQSNFTEKILSSMKLIGEELNEIKKELEGSKVLGEFDVENSQMKNVSYRRDILYKQHQLLGEILNGFIINFIENIKTTDFTSIMSHVEKFDSSDIFLLSYFPAAMAYVSSLDKLPESQVHSLHKQFMDDINDIEKLADFPFKALIILAFFTSFIDWVNKSKDLKDKYPFQMSIESPMEKTIAVGALEQFLSIAADTSIIETTGEGKPYYDFRGFLQRHIPKYIPVRCMDVDENATNRMKRNLLAAGTHTSTQIENMKPLYTDVPKSKMSAHFIEFIVTVLHNFAYGFVSNASFVLTTLRDQEEDMLLSQENDIEGVAENADLERAYLGMFYLYSYRPELGTSFWLNADKNSSNDLYGFLKWGSKCNSPLIMASFSMLLSALSSSQQNAEHLFNFLQTTNSESGSIGAMRNSNSLSLKYGSISWSTIYSSLAYYNNQLKSIHSSEQQSLAVRKPEDSSNKVVMELGEDSVIFLASMFQILISVSKHSPKARKSLLESDDGQLIGLLQVLLTSVSENVIKGTVLNVLSCLIGSDSLHEVNEINKQVNNKFEIDTREKIWKVLDTWLLQNTSISLPMDRLAKELNSYPLISGFTKVLSSLLSPLPSFDEKLELYDNQRSSRSANSSVISLYIEFLIVHVFPSIEYSGTGDIVTEVEKNNLQLVVLRLICQLLEPFDPKLIEMSQASGLKEIDRAISFNESNAHSNGVVEYLQSHPGSATLKALYQNSVYETIFKLANVGIDNLNQLTANSVQLELVKASLSVVELILERDTFYITDLVPILRLKDNRFMDPASVGSGTSGLRNFYDAFLLNLDFVASVALYVSSYHSFISKKCLNIFKHIAASELFDSSSIYMSTLGSSKSKLLIILETIDESQRVRDSWIQQYESNVNFENDEVDVAIGNKIAILEFLVSDLNDSSSANLPSISHFLLGFDTKNFDLGSESEFGLVNSPRSLLKSIVESLSNAISGLQSTHVEHFHIRIAYLAMEILLILSKSKIVGHKILSWMKKLNESNLVGEFLKNTGIVSTMTMWDGQKFDENVNAESDFSVNGDSFATVIFFVKFRSSFFEFLAEVFNDAMRESDYSAISYYIKFLTKSTGYGTDLNKILEFLDLTSFQTNVSISKIDEKFQNFDLKFIVSNVKLLCYKEGNSHYDTNIVDKMTALLAIEQTRGTMIERHAIIFSLMEKKEHLRNAIVASLNNDNFKWSFLRYLKSWSTLTQFVSKMGFQYENPSTRSNFILEVFQSVIPKIDEYLESETTYAEILVSTCVKLLNIYVDSEGRSKSSNNEIETKSIIDARRLLPLFQICIKGIVSPYSTPNLRSDLYILGEKFLESTMITKDIIISTDLLIFMKSVDFKFFDIMFNDSIIGENENKLSSLFFIKSFLKCLTRLSNIDGDNKLGNGYTVMDGIQISEQFINEVFCKGGYVLGLIQQLKFIDDHFKTTSDGEKIVKELTCFRLIIAVFSTLAQSRIGAHTLMNCNIFEAIRGCGFLNSDVEFDWKFKKNIKNSDETETISLNEILIAVFQMLTTIVIVVGPDNAQCSEEIKKTERHFEVLIQSAFKKEILQEEMYGTENHEDIGGVRKLTELFALLNALSQ